MLTARPDHDADGRDALFLERCGRLIERIPHTRRNLVTDFGLVSAIFLTRLHNRVLYSGPGDLTSTGPSPPRLRRAFDALIGEIDTLAREHRLVA